MNESLRKNPSVYEINTLVWLTDIEKKYGRSLALGSIPAEEWDQIAGYHFDAVWLMGVWERSPEGVAISMRNESLWFSFNQALPDFSPQDNAGSPYCIRRYSVDDRLGGAEGLAAARNALKERGMHLILDFVPNHVAPDHAWVKTHPEFFIQGSPEDINRSPADFLLTEGGIIACGRDPFSPPWPDVAQLNLFNPGLRQVVRNTLIEIASQCDGVRCDMAMLAVTRIFDRTWGNRAGKLPAHEYWPEIIQAVREVYPGFTFIAESYWDMEYELQQEGFNFCYDKRLYDRLEKESAESVRLHLQAKLGFQQKLVRFIENHDEPRAATVFSRQKARTAALTAATLPGMRLFHEGQFEGRRVRLPVFLSRRPYETLDVDLSTFYSRLLEESAAPLFHEGEWRLCERNGWWDNPGYLNIVAWSWNKEDSRCLVVVNLSGARSQARVRLPWDDLNNKVWTLTDPFNQTEFTCSGDELQDPGLFVDLREWEFHFLFLKN